MQGYSEDMMTAVEFSEHGAPGLLHLAERRRPEVQPGTVLIHVRAAGISPVDLGIRSGQTAITVDLPHVPGLDAAGVVVAVGDGVTGTQVGDEVFGTVALTAFGGASAEYAVLATWADRPEAMSWEQAAAAGTSVETATRALDVMEVGAGMTVLIDGAAGGVGLIASQLAVARGAHVIAVARAEAMHAVRTLPGVTPVTVGSDFTWSVYQAGIKQVDVAMDMAGAGRLPELIELVGDAARVLTIADFTAAQYGVRLTQGALAGEADGASGLAVAAALASEGRFTVQVKSSHPFSRAAEAHAAAEVRPRWGKVVLVNDSAAAADGEE